ncbi:hypothetical protein FIBSPDRAFT_1050668 [Athelia psychrophila]|uniref:Uncharacterized protein n=1 Tax=Athelia psychrophila TaxID=1759441 RepID=A0A166AIF7_9AGAM|nr:hypothetical protein FIBSPDRAFT_1050668 [Fibularhizoctonia sp. CBS 109695]
MQAADNPTNLKRPSESETPLYVSSPKITAEVNSVYFGYEDLYVNGQISCRRHKWLGRFVLKRKLKSLFAKRYMGFPGLLRPVPPTKFPLMEYAAGYDYIGLIASFIRINERAFGEAPSLSSGAAPLPNPPLHRHLSIR